MTTKDAGSRKIAIQKEGFFAILYAWKPDTSVDAVVKDICTKWSLTKQPEQYALQYLDTKIYITEDNNKEIQDGDILTLTFTPELAASKFLSDIEQPDLTVKRAALNQLAGIDGAGQADDPQFAREFVNRKGINALVKIIESNSEPSDVIAQAMAAIQDLLEHGFVTWEHSVNQKFVEKVLLFANKTDASTDQKIIQKALVLLDNIVTMSSTLFILVMNKIGMDNLVSHLRSNNPKLQLSAASLCNSIFLRMEHVNRMKFSTELGNRGFTNGLQKIITSSIAHATPLSSEMNHQLYVYHSLLLSLYQPRMNQKPDFGNQALLAELNDIYNIAFESAPSVKETDTNKLGKPDFKRLGFINGGAPLIDFEECPPGVLAYDAMMYFAKNHHDQYVKLILENFGRDEEYECPFAKSTISLVKVLCEVLNVGATISDMSEDYQPIVFSTSHVFEELFCVCIQLFNKTWKEMRATSGDFTRVIGVVKDQIKRVLNEKPESLEKFKTKAFGLTYPQILRLMQQEAQERNILDSQTKPVMELRQLIEPEIRELVRQQRLAQLVQGECFSYFSTKGKPKDKYWFCCLSPNHRFLHYGDVESKDVQPQIEELAHKLPLSDVNLLIIGKDSPHMKNWRGNKGYFHLAFSIMHGQEEHLDFVAPSPQSFSVWSDALSTLLGKPMSSKEFQDDLDMLLNMEMKLLLLDLDDVRIPEQPPVIPREPDNYDFYYQNN